MEDTVQMAFFIVNIVQLTFLILNTVQFNRGEHFCKPFELGFPIRFSVTVTSQMVWDVTVTSQTRSENPLV